MRILLVEDRPDIRELLATELRASGHCVEEAYDVKMALAALATLGCCDAVISDVVLPGGSGVEIAEAATNAGIPVLLCTGHPDAMMLLQARGIRHLRKPFPPSALVAWIDATSGSPAPG
jgi:DNA-binding response OmpR family regulator